MSLTVLGETVEGILTLIPVLPLLALIAGVKDFTKETFHYDMPTFDDSGKPGRGWGPWRSR